MPNKAAITEGSTIERQSAALVSSIDAEITNLETLLEVRRSQRKVLSSPLIELANIAQRLNGNGHKTSRKAVHKKTADEAVDAMSAPRASSGFDRDAIQKAARHVLKGGTPATLSQIAEQIASEFPGAEKRTHWNVIVSHALRADEALKPLSGKRYKLR